MSEEQSTPQENQPENTGQPQFNQQQQFNQQSQFPPFGNSGFQYGVQQNLPNATAVLILGILSIVGCCCYGLPSVIMAIIALVLSKKDRTAYALNPSIYSDISYKNLNAGRICAIIGLSLAILATLYYIAVFVMFGTGMLSDPEKMQEIIRGLQ